MSHISGRGSERVMFKRLSWSPDGTALCVTAATKSEKSIAVILKRNEWISVADLVGHATDVLSARFLPLVLSNNDPSLRPSHPSHTEGSG
jgi:protein HIRA/HIR1